MLNVVVKGAFHQPVCAKGLLDVTFETFFRVEFNWLEVFDVQRVKKHIPYSSFFLVDPERVSGENDSFKDASKRIGGESDSCSHYLVTLG